MAGSRRTATRVTRGAISLSSSSHFPLKLYSNCMKPVTLPPGRARLSTKPAPTGSVTFTNTIGTVRVACCNAATIGRAVARMTSGASATSSAAYLRMRRHRRAPADIDPHVAAVGPAQLLQALQERRDAGCVPDRPRPCHEHADAPHPLGLLRARRERPRCRRATENTEKFPPPHVRPLAQETASYRLKRVL